MEAQRNIRFDNLRPLQELVNNNPRMDAYDAVALTSVIGRNPTHLDQHVDIVRALDELCKRRILVGAAGQKFYVKYVFQYRDETPKEQFFSFFCDLVKMCSFTEILIFTKCVSLDKFAHDLEQERIIVPVGIGGADISSTEDLQKFCSEIKCNLDNNVFDDGCQMVSRIAQMRCEKLTLASEEETRQHIAEQYVGATWLKINTLRDGNLYVRLGTLDDMMKNVPSTLNSAYMYAKLIYLTKGAVSHALASDWIHALRNVDDAKSQMILCKHHFVKVLMYHDFMYIYHLLYAQKLQPAVLNDLVEMGRHGLQILNEMEGPYRIVWERIFKLHMAMALLCIGPKLDVIYGKPINAIDNVAAKALVEQVGDPRNFKGISSRNEIDFYLCKARINEEEHDLENAVFYATMAENLAKDGTPFPKDKNHITEYKNRLVNKC